MRSRLSLRTWATRRRRWPPVTKDLIWSSSPGLKIAGFGVRVDDRVGDDAHAVLPRNKRPPVGDRYPVSDGCGWWISEEIVEQLKGRKGGGSEDPSRKVRRCCIC